MFENYTKKVKLTTMNENEEIEEREFPCASDFLKAMENEEYLEKDENGRYIIPLKNDKICQLTFNEQEDVSCKFNCVGDLIIFLKAISSALSCIGQG